MRRPHLPLLCGLLLCAPASAAGAPVEFNRDIRPILSDACFACHGPDKAKRKADLRLDTEEGGREAVVPGKSSESELFRRIVAEDESERMPPSKATRKLKPHEIELLKRWIEEGAMWEKHWAYIPPKRPPTPEVKNGAAVRNPIDSFVVSRLEKEGLSPSPEAPRATLIRRLSLDLTGLPPTPAEVDAFLKDASPNAYEKLVDRLLRSQRYGERMAHDWLDAARYADSNGYQSDRTRTMWPWRDWVVRQFNENTPFDRFTVEQIAGDLLPAATRETRLATGFHRNHPLNGEGGRIAEESRVDYVVDRVDTTATVWLGLTLGCARCHDHKYDPLSQKDYYGVYAFFNNVAETGAVDRGGNAAPVMRLPSPEQEKRQAQLTAEVAELEAKLRADRPRPTPQDAGRSAVAALLRLAPGASAVLRLPDAVAAPVAPRRAMLQKLAAARKASDDLSKAVPEVMVMEERSPPRQSFVLVRGAYDKPGEKVTPAVPAGLAPLPKGAPDNRLGLARWLVAPENPLTARVVANRYWQMLFGVGLVKTAEDFGVQGEPPVHQELLDWLATEFVRSGWDVKALLRLIVTSGTYRQSSKVSAELRERDPDNRLLARGARFRLPSQVIRDQALFVGGLLVEKLGGPPVKPYQPPGIWEEMSFNQIRYTQDHGKSLYRRSLYTFWRRTVGPPNLFDASARQVCVVKPSVTNTPLHALVTLNDVTYAEAYRALAERVMKHGGATPADRLAFAFRLATAREPSTRERELLTAAYERLLKQYGADRDAALKAVSAGESPRDAKLDVVQLAAYTGVATLILNLDEVLTKE